MPGPLQDGSAHVGLHVANEAQRELDDVSGRRGAHWSHPLALVLQQRRLFLGAGDGDATVLLGLLLAELGPGHRTAKQGSNGLIVQGLAFDAVEAFGLLLRVQQLHGARAITTDGREQVECALGIRSVPLREAFSDGAALRQKVLEEVVYEVAAQWLVMQQRQWQRK